MTKGLFCMTVAYSYNAEIASNAGGIAFNAGVTTLNAGVTTLNSGGGTHYVGDLMNTL